MKTIEEIKKQMVLGATSVEEHREAPTAQAVTQFRQTLLTDLPAAGRCQGDQRKRQRRACRGDGKGARAA